MKFKKFFWDYLYFTQIERYGIVFLLAFCLALFAVPKIYATYFARHDNNDGTLPAMALPVSLKSEVTPEKVAPIRKNFRFNPNTASLDDFIALGLSEKTAKSILNYRNKGGKFRKPADFAKIYTLSPGDFQRLEQLIAFEEHASQQEKETTETELPSSAPVTAPITPFDPNTVNADQLKQLRLPPATVNGWLNYLKKGGKFRFREDIQKLYSLTPDDYQRILPSVLLPSKDEIPQKPIAYSTGFYKKTEASPIDINSAETTAWVTLPGIGEGWARKILNWRDKLGGFVTVDQVAETRFLPDSVFQKAKPYLKCAPTTCQQISINTADWQTLNEHPYIEPKHARWIIAYREQHGLYHNLEDLLKIPELKPDWLQKVRPYLSI